MNTTYCLAILIGAAICTALFAWKMHSAKLKPLTALLALPLAVVLGAVMAKLVYFVLELRDMLVTYDGVSGILSMKPDEFSFLGGCFGVVLAVMLTALISGQKVLPVLDAFAPCGALMAAITRACEGLLDPMSLIGMGAFVGDEKWWFFPVAVENEFLYSWFYAVFMLEAAFALVCAVGSFVISMRWEFAPGRVFLHTVFFLALTQILSEQVLNKFMAWGFVRIEQLLCALIVFGILLYACIMRGKMVAFVPAVLCLLCAGVLIWMEFALDNKPLFNIEIPTLLCYGIMIAALGCMAGLSLYSYHKLNKAE